MSGAGLFDLNLGHIAAVRFRTRKPGCALFDAPQSLLFHRFHEPFHVVADDFDGVTTR